jgi:hypothetical protein
LADSSQTPEEQALGQKLAAATGTIDRLDSALSTSIGISRENVRAHVTKAVIWVYLLSLGGSILWIMNGDGSQGFHERVKEVFELLKIGAIPIVTFVIGHYFGSQSN